VLFDAKKGLLSKGIAGGRLGLLVFLGGKV